MDADQEKKIIEGYRRVIRSQMMADGARPPDVSATIEYGGAEVFRDGSILVWFVLDDGDEIEVKLQYVGDGKVYCVSVQCDACFAAKSCSHWRRAVLNFAFGSTRDDLEDWLEFEVGRSAQQGGPANSKAIWPYICFKVENDRLLVAVIRTEETVENGAVVSALFKTSISPKQLLNEATKKPSGVNRDILEQFATTLVDLNAVDDSNEWWVVPEIASGALLIEASNYSKATYRRNGKFNYLSLEPVTELQYAWAVDDEAYTAQASGLVGGTFFYRSVPMVHLSDDGSITPFTLQEDWHWRDARLIERMPPILVEDAVEAFRRIHEKRSDFPLPAPDRMGPIDLGDQRLTNVLRIVQGEDCTVAKLSFRYLQGVEIDGDTPPLAVRSVADKTYRIKRSLKKEEQAFLVLKQRGLNRVDGSDTYEFASELEVSNRRDGRHVADLLFWARFIDNVIPILKSQGWRVFLPKKAIVEFIDCPTIAGGYDDDPSDKNTYRMTLGIEVDGEVISLLPLIVRLLGEYDWDKLDKAIPHGTDFAHLEMGGNRVVRIPAERLRTILKMVADSLRYYDAEHEVLRLPLRQSGSVGLLDEKLGPGIEWQGSGRVQRLVEVFNGFHKAPTATMPETITSTLEGYQLEGVSLMAFMADHGFPMLLCDEMGLGKTLQLLSVYAIAKSKDPSIGPALVMVNTAGLSQWTDEVEKHCPSLRVAQTNTENEKIVPVARRHQYYDDCDAGKLDVLVSTYGKIYNDIERVRTIVWHTVFADEAQIVNSPTSKKKRKLPQLDCTFLYPATGTPIENNLMELWSLFDISMHGYLGTQAWFRREYAKPIENDQDAEALYRLKKLIAPFVRRKLRSDSDVTLKIPDPHVELINIALSGAQRDLYESVRVVQENVVRDLLKKQGMKQATSMVINAILGMRQIVCDPTLYKRQDHGVVESAKMRAMEQLLDKFRSDGRQALVFTNFETMMALFRRAADRCGISHSIISGKVTKRDPIIDDYRAGNHQVLFATLGTMNASIDLYNAKAVVIYEPWWNPQKESQGIGRMVRRGQEDETTVYRLVAQDTVERQLMKKQDKKLALVDAIFAEDLDALNTGLSEEDIRGLFSPR